MTAANDLHQLATRRRRLYAALLCLAAFAAYGDSFGGQFVFDDNQAIEENSAIRSLLPITRFLWRTNRPLWEVSLAANYAISGLDPWSYHALNLLVHTAAGLLLFGVVRQTLRLPSVSGAFGRRADELAFTIALIWLVHPLQTQSVTYIVQRCESMMGTFFLLCLYCVIRGAQRRRAWPWYPAAALACAAGMGCKEVMVTASPVILLYDRIFLAGSWAELWKRRGWLHIVFLALALALVLRVTHSYGASEVPSAGFSYRGATWWEYLLTQPGVILHYFWLAVWPHALCLDYMWPLARTAQEIVIPSLAIVSLLLGSFLALRYRPALGFLGVSFFLILAPTSSIMPIADCAVEHRMYLPLAPLVTFVVLGAYHATRRMLTHKSSRQSTRNALSACLVAAAAVTLGTLTYLRNEDYGSDVRIWQDTITKAPDNPRAHANLAHALIEQGEFDEGIAQCRQALRLDPNWVNAHNNLGRALVQKGNVDEAIGHYRRALQIEPDNAQFHHNLAHALAQDGSVDEALVHAQRAVDIRKKERGERDLRYAESLNNLGLIYQTAGDYVRARSLCREALEIWEEALGENHPEYAAGLNNLAMLDFRTGDYAHAEQLFERAVQINPDDPSARFNLGMVLYRTGKDRAAVAQWRAALRASPNHVVILTRTAWVLATSPDAALRDGQEAVRMAEQAIRCAGRATPELLDVLAAAHAEAGRFSTAVEIAKQAIAMAGPSKPTFAETLRRRLKRYQAGSAYRDVRPAAGPTSPSR